MPVTSGPNPEADTCLNVSSSSSAFETDVCNWDLAAISCRNVAEKADMFHRVGHAVHRRGLRVGYSTVSERDGFFCTVP